MIINKAYNTFLLFSLLLLFSCTGKNSKSRKPQSFGSPNKIFVVSDRLLWESPVKDTLDTYFGAAYPILPHAEPIFDLPHFTIKEIQEENDRLRWHLMMFLVDMSDTSSAVTKMAIKDLGLDNINKDIQFKGYSVKIGKNKWANNQMIIYMIGEDRASINVAIRENFLSCYDKIKTFDIPKLNAMAYSQGHNRDAQSIIRKKYGFNMKVPKAFKILPVENDLTWLQFETELFYQTIVIQEIDYTSPEQFSQKSLKAMTDSLGRKYISSFADSTYLVVNDVDLPLYYETHQKEDQFMAYINGIWELENDFMGGPFTTHLIKPQDGNKLYFVFSYVYAPSKEKRDYMVNIQHILTSISFDKPKK